MPRRFVYALCCFVLLTGCAAHQESQNAPLPTLFPSPTPQFGDPEAALRVAAEFLHNWQTGDYTAMYNLISFASQQATPFEMFRTTYETAQSAMRLQNLEFEFLAESQHSHRVIEYAYNVTFTSSVIGTFTDTERSLILVREENSADWRVAWSPGNIFAEMGQGGLLRFRSFPPRRANIYDRTGTILADMNGIVVTINITKSEVPQLETCIQTLAQVLNVTADSIHARLNNYSSNQLAEIGVIEPALYTQWANLLEIDCAAQFDRRATRRYIDGDLAPHVIGYVGYPDEADIPAVEAAGFPKDSILGKNGVEASWDETLRGHPGGELTIVSPDGNVLRMLAEVSAQPAQSVYLTIDADLQRYVAQVIQDAYASAAEAWAPGSDGASLVMMDVNTGAILAMVSYPTFDANAFTPFPDMGREAAQRLVQQAQSDERRPLVNRVTQGTYPTGSTMKVVTAITALDSGVYTFDETYTSIGIWSRDIPRTDWRAGGHGTVNLAQALTVSCNTCFYEVGYRLNETDPYLFSTYARRLGLSVPTGIREVTEEVGLIGNPDNKQSYEPTGVPWNFSDMVNIAIGQGGVAVTPLQLMRAYSSVANDGTLYRPQLVDRVGLLDEFSYQMTPDPMSQTGIKPEVLAYIREGLCNVTTSPAGTATHIFRLSRLLEFGVCGKTGTATAADGQGLPHAWFVGYAPRENPQVIVLAMVENSGDGSAVAAPIVCRVLEYYYFDDTSPNCGPD